MKITGLITEYNPFHNGHQYHITRSKEVAGADYCICLMSGSFVQRGEPAVFDKYVRTSMALRAGADLVLEMPAAFSTSSAMEFAGFGIALFTALGLVDSVCFGSESGQMEPLRKLAELFLEESEDFKALLRSSLKQGMTYPEARNYALSASREYQNLLPEEKGILKSPNNLLGIEYLRAGLHQNSPLNFYTIRREGSDYHALGLPSGAIFPSASAIRRFLENNWHPESGQFLKSERSPESGRLLTAGCEQKTLPAPEELSRLIPKASLEALRGEVPVFSDDFSSLLNYRILAGDWDDIADLSPELEARLRKSALPPASFSERILALKSRQLTYTRVSRALLHLLLDLRTEQREQWKKEGCALYARILGFRKESAPLLNALKKSSSIPLVTKVADAGKQLSPSAMAMLEQEIRVSHLYQMVKSEKGGLFRNEYRQGVVIEDGENV